MSNVRQIEKVLLGSDIEFFLQDVNTKEIVSAEGFAKGTKHKPFNFDPSDKFWATSLDNVAYEGNIPPVVNKLGWFNSINYLRDYMDKSLPQNLCTVALPSHDFDAKWLDTPNAMRFGCDTSYCVWTRSANEPPETTTNTRSTGFHIHSSWPGMDIEWIEEWIKAMDLFLGVPSVLIEPENKRRNLYGKAGEFRFSKNFDRAEYRALSSYFAGSKELIDYTYDQTFEAINFLNQGNTIDLEGTFADEIRQAINTSDKGLAEKIVKENNILVLA